MFEAFPTAGVKPAVGAEYQEGGIPGPEMERSLYRRSTGVGDTVLGRDPG